MISQPLFSSRACVYHLKKSRSQTFTPPFIQSRALGWERGVGPGGQQGPGVGGAERGLPGQRGCAGRRNREWGTAFLFQTELLHPDLS